MEYPIRLPSQNDNLKIYRKEMDFLRVSIEKVYKAHGGQKKLGNSTNKIYIQLGKSIADKIKEDNILLCYKESNGQELEIQEPGYTFLKDLFYTHKDNEKANYRQYNVDLCYIYISGLNRSDFEKSREQEIKQRDKKVVESQKAIIKVIISSRRCCMSEVETLKNYIETQFGCTIEKHWVESKGIPLISLYKHEKKKKISETPLVFHLIGLNYFQDKNCIQGLSDAIKKYPAEIKNRSIIICLKDITEGAININSHAGKYKISEFWINELKYVESTYTVLSTIKAKNGHQGIYKKENADIESLKLLIPDVVNTFNFIVSELVLIQYDHFLNYLMLDDLKKLFKNLFPKEFE